MWKFIGKSCPLMLMMLAWFLCFTGGVNAQEDAFVEKRKGLTDLILGNQTAILVVLVLVITITLAWCSFHYLRFWFDRLEEDHFGLEELALKLGMPTVTGQYRSRPTASGIVPNVPSLFALRTLSAALHLNHYRILYAVIAMILIVGIAIAVFLWRADAKVLDETGGLSLPEPLVNRQSAKAALVFIHGWKGDDTTWAQLPTLASRDGQLQDADIYIVNYPTYMRLRNSSVGGLAKWLWQDFFEGILRPKYAEIHIISHSMGGLIGRQLYIAEHNRHSQTGQLKIRSLISIASPFQGADIASLATILGVSKDLVSDMEPNSLSDAAGQWSFIRPGPVTHCFTSPQDKIVSQWSARGQCECSFEYLQWGHTDMVKPTDMTDARYRNPIRALTGVLGTDVNELRKQNHNFGL
jgi:hypothetical protein